VGPKLSIGIVALFLSALSACGGSSDETTTTPRPVALERCTRSDGVTHSGYNWSAKVSGISCDQVGRFIRHEAFARPEQITGASDFKAAGYACDSSRSEKYGGGWHVVCINADRRFTFEWTP
jgi:hypothetical protein